MTRAVTSTLLFTLAALLMLLVCAMQRRSGRTAWLTLAAGAALALAALASAART